VAIGHQEYGAKQPCRAVAMMDGELDCVPGHGSIFGVTRPSGPVRDPI
jgi:hypothetical protein